MSAVILSVSPLFGDDIADDAAGRLKALAAAADAAGFDLLLLGHGGHPVDLDPLMTASALCALTRRIGLGAAVTTALGEPFTLARAFSALDPLSGGRSAWQIVTQAPDAAPFAHRPSLDPADAAPRAREFLQAASALWDSWDADAILGDKPNAEFSDPAKVRRIDHQGQFFQVRGPLNSPPPRQGRPLIVQTGDADADWIAATADVVVIRAADRADAETQGALFHRLAAARGRRLRALVETSMRDAVARRGWLCEDAMDGLHVLAPLGEGDALDRLAARLGGDRTRTGDLRERLGLRS